VSWQLVFSKHAEKDAKKLAAAGLKSKPKSCSPFCQTIHFRIRRPTKSSLVILQAHTHGALFAYQYPAPPWSTKSLSKERVVRVFGLCTQDVVAL
jgi:hypothetical protein